MQSALEKKCREIVESKLKNGQCGFHPGCNITDQIYTLKQILREILVVCKGCLCMDPLHGLLI